MTRLVGAGSVAAGTFAAATALPAGPVPAVLALAGVGGIGLGVHRRDRGHIQLGTLALLSGVLLAATAGLDPGLVLLGTVGTVLSWDAATVALDLSEHLTPAAETARAATVHLGATAVVVSALAGVVYVVALLGRGALPPFSALLLLVGAGLVAYGTARWGSA